MTTSSYPGAALRELCSYLDLQAQETGTEGYSSHKEQGIGVRKEAMERESREVHVYLGNEPRDCCLYLSVCSALVAR